MTDVVFSSEGAHGEWVTKMGTVLPGTFSIAGTRPTFQSSPVAVGGIAAARLLTDQIGANLKLNLHKRQQLITIKHYKRKLSQLFL